MIDDHRAQLIDAAREWLRSDDEYERAHELMMTYTRMCDSLLEEKRKSGRRIAQLAPEGQDVVMPLEVDRGVLIENEYEGRCLVRSVRLVGGDVAENDDA